MEPSGPTYSQKDTKREPKAAKMEAEAPTLIVFMVKKVRQKAINKKNDVQKASVPGRQSEFELFGPDRLFPGFIF